ncbi:MAG TPA: Flp pilus assembly protein CpaB [Magnetospirillum sp.]|nr:Flp pilus assembly protein CpaB [Magnetospirillum sp.]
MRPMRLAVVVVAVLAAGMTALLARNWLAAQKAAPVPQAVAMAEVLVAARDLPAGTVLQAQDMRYDRWPASAVPAKLIARHAGDDPRGRFVGQVSRREMVDGEPVTTQALRQNSSGMLAGMLGNGMRAVSVAISNTSAAAGFITPGDRVDVVLAADLVRTEGNNGATQSGPMVRYAAETVLTDVKVLAIDQSATRSRDGGAVEGKTATLEVTPKQAELLAAASMLGSLSLALRSADAADGAQQSKAATPFTTDTEASRALDALHHARPKPAQVQGGAQVMVNRAGQISAQTFGR